MHLKMTQEALVKKIILETSILAAVFCYFYKKYMLRGFLELMAINSVPELVGVEPAKE